MARIDLDLAHSYKPNPKEDGDYALLPLKMTFADGGAYALLGPSGCGKTTMLNIMSGLLVPSHGTVKFDGQDVTRLGVHERVRRGLRRTFQSSRVLRTLSVRENLVLAVQGVRRNRMSPRRWAVEREVLRETDRLMNVSMLAPQRDRPAGELSHGQQRQLEIAMGLAGEPKLLLADEPTGNLDSQMARSVMDLLEELHREGATIVMVTHDPQLAARAQRNVHIIDGQVSDLDLGRNGPRSRLRGDALVDRFATDPAGDLLSLARMARPVAFADILREKRAGSWWALLSGLAAACPDRFFLHQWQAAALSDSAVSGICASGCPLGYQ